MHYPRPVTTTNSSVFYSTYCRLSNRLRRGRKLGWTRRRIHEWLRAVNDVNRCYLVGPTLEYLACQPRGHALLDVDCVVRLMLENPPARYRYQWPMGFNTLAAEWGVRLKDAPEDHRALRYMFDRQLSRDGRWLSPIDHVDTAMKGYSLLFLAQKDGSARYEAAARNLALALLEEVSRTDDGTLFYDRNSGMMLVDTLGMVCPFLARFSRQVGDVRAVALAARQLTQFIAVNVDHESHLPYHAYYHRGPARLGLHGWGRGTGWYMLGLVDTLGEMEADHADREALMEAFCLAWATLVRNQRSDGHWNWAIQHRDSQSDASATAMIGYAVTRGVQLGLLEPEALQSASAAIDALIQTTDVAGQVQGGSGECLGPGKYSQVYGKQQWLQGATSAFGNLFQYVQPRAWAANHRTC